MNEYGGEEFEREEGDNGKENEDDWEVTEEKDENVDNVQNKFNDNYNALSLIEDLRDYLERIASPADLYQGKITDEKLGNILSEDSKLIYKIKKNIKRNPDFKLNLDLLQELETKVCNLFVNQRKSLKRIIEKYRELNKLNINSEHIYRHHPNIKIDYFKDIDTKEKAYWLGFIYADGFITRDRNILRFGMGISEKDEIIIDKFCKAIDLNPNYKQYVHQDNTVRIRIANNRFSKNLENHGVIVGSEKSKNIKLPELKNTDLDLAFLLGHFDGDGTTGTSRITTGSKQFLEQIIEKFRIKNTIYEYEGNYKLYLGAALFNKMLENYQNSLPKKRIRLRSFD
jgi:hypothetical protein